MLTSVCLRGGLLLHQEPASAGPAGGAAPGPIPACLWTARGSEPDPKSPRMPAAIFLWGRGGSTREQCPDRPHPAPIACHIQKPMADRSLKARDEIMSGNPQERHRRKNLADNDAPAGEPWRKSSGRNSTPSPIPHRQQYRPLSQLQALQTRRRAWNSSPIVGSPCCHRKEISRMVTRSGPPAGARSSPGRPPPRWLRAPGSRDQPRRRWVVCSKPCPDAGQ